MSLGAWLLRRAMGRLRITPDIQRHLSTLQRLGETAATQLGSDWVWPYWIERQIDPRSPAFVPRGHLPVLANVTHRNWTMVGNAGSPWEPVVDPRGLVTPWFDGWSLDWWIGADDRWHLPSREHGVRQRLVDDAPVVETLLSVPTGDAVQRVYAVHGGDGLGEVVVVEVENRSHLPFALALSVRPYNAEGLAVIERIALHDRTVTVDGRPALVLPRPPGRMASSTFRDGDVAGVVMSGAAGDSLVEARDPAGMASAAFLLPVTQGTTVRACIPITAERRTRRPALARRRVTRTSVDPASLPSAEAVARGWRALAGRGMRLVLPDSGLAAAVEANRRFLLLLADGPDITPGPTTYHRFWFRDAAYMLAALDRYGYHREAAEVLRSYPGRQHAGGFFFSQRQEWDSNGAAIFAIAEHWRLTRDRELLEAVLPSVERGMAWIDRKRRSGRRRDPEVAGLLPASISAEHLGPFDWYFWDDLWSLKGLRDGAALVRAAGGAADVAARADGWADDLSAALDASMALASERIGSLAIPAGPHRRLDPGAIGSLAACWPLGLFPPDDPRIVATADYIRDHHLVGEAFFQGISHTGLGTYLTLQLAFVELEAGDTRALDRLAWLRSAATSTHTWPEAIHPQLGTGCMGDGHHGWAAADFLSFVRAMLVRERAGDAGLALCSMLPTDWRGQPVEVHDAPTHHGPVSFALRWHGDRPALLWDLDAHDGVGPVRITAPGLDPSWSSTERRGDALLAAPDKVRAGS